jgi:hypothetical protein
MPKTLVQKVVSKEPGVRVFVVHSDERLAFERAQRIKAMDRVRTRLEKLQRRIVDGRLKAPDKNWCHRRQVPRPQSWAPLLRLVLRRRTTEMPNGDSAQFAASIRERLPHV